MLLSLQNIVTFGKRISFHDNKHKLWFTEKYQFARRILRNILIAYREEGSYVRVSFLHVEIQIKNPES